MNDAHTMRIRYTAVAGIRAEKGQPGRLDVHGHDRPAASREGASVPSPQPTSIAMRPAPAPSRSPAASSSSGRGSRPDDHA